MTEGGYTWTQAYFTHKSVAHSAYLPSARTDGREPKSDSIQRPWIIDPDQADRFARKALQIAAAPKMKGRIRVRRTRAIRPDGIPLGNGDNFVLDYRPLSLDLIARVTGVEIPFTAAYVDIDWESERGQLPLPYVPPAAVVPERILPAVPAITHARALVLHPFWAVGELPGVLMMVARPDPTLTEASVWLSVDGGVSYGMQPIATLGAETHNQFDGVAHHPLAVLAGALAEHHKAATVDCRR